MILLMILYSFQVTHFRFYFNTCIQGLPIGLFLSSVPILFKKYLSYSDIGLIMMCTMPFSLKVLWSPFVDVYYSKRIGKRKSWIIPTQLIVRYSSQMSQTLSKLSMFLFYMSGTLETMLMNKEIFMVTVLFTIMIFIITCQDIAVDSWAVEILHENNSSYASTCQTVGQTVGCFISNSLFIALNSIEFCNKYIYSSEQTEPLLSIGDFMFYWSQVQLFVTLYILIFVNEKQRSDHSHSQNDLNKPNSNDKSGPEEMESQKRQQESEENNHESNDYSLSQVILVLKDLLSNKYILSINMFYLILNAGLAIDGGVSQIYLTNELGFSKENFSLIQLISAPTEILYSLIGGYFNSKSPFKFTLYMSILCLFTSSYTILVLFATFPKEPSTWTFIHVIGLTLFKSFVQTCFFTAKFATVFRICDKRISGLFITLMATLSNLSYSIHKLYIFKIVEYFGIFIPQAMITVIVIIYVYKVKDTILEMDNVPKESWAVSENVLKKVKQA
eukprot:403348030